NDVEYRVRNPVSPKLTASICSGIDKIFMRSGSNVLYLARLDDSSIFTISYISDIGYKDGMVFVVGKSDVIQEVDNFRLLDIRSNVQFNAVDNTKYDDSAAAYKNSIDNLGKRIDVLFCDVGHLDHVCLLSCYPCFVLCIKVGRWGMSEKEVEFNVDFLAKWAFGNMKWNLAEVGDSQLRHLFPRLFALETKKDCSVASKIQSSVISTFRRPVKGGIETAQLDLLEKSIEGTILSTLDDRWIWDLNGEGVFQGQILALRSPFSAADFLKDIANHSSMLASNQPPVNNSIDLSGGTRIKCSSVVPKTSDGDKPKKPMDKEPLVDLEKPMDTPMAKEERLKKESKKKVYRVERGGLGTVDEHFDSCHLLRAMLLFTGGWLDSSILEWLAMSLRKWTTEKGHPKFKYMALRLIEERRCRKESTELKNYLTDAIDHNEDKCI
ncbi:RNA-directed DNA polymerase, eukaryota, partial [Tanacetum coccineum]